MQKNESTNGVQYPIALAIAVSIWTGSVTAQSFGPPRENDRSQRWEAYGGARWASSASIDFDGGSTLDTDDDLGFAFGFGYNFNEHLNLGGDLAWNRLNYDGTLVSGDSPQRPAERISGQIDTSSLSVIGTWHLLKGPLTPYGSATLGWTWVDTNIADGPPETGCWWDPWWGFICAPFVNTITEDSFSYGLGLGLRWDFAPGAFGRLGYQHRWFDFDNASGTPDVGAIRIEFGGKF